MSSNITELAKALAVVNKESFAKLQEDMEQQLVEAVMIANESGTAVLDEQRDKKLKELKKELRNAVKLDKKFLSGKTPNVDAFFAGIPLSYSNKEILKKYKASFAATPNVAKLDANLQPLKRIVDSNGNLSPRSQDNFILAFTNLLETLKIVTVREFLKDFFNWGKAWDEVIKGSQAELKALKESSAQEKDNKIKEYGLAFQGKVPQGKTKPDKIGDNLETKQGKDVPGSGSASDTHSGHPAPDPNKPVPEVTKVKDVLAHLDVLGKEAEYGVGLLQNRIAELEAEVEQLRAAQKVAPDSKGVSESEKVRLAEARAKSSEKQYTDLLTEVTNIKRDLQLKTNEVNSLRGRIQTLEGKKPKKEPEPESKAKSEQTLQDQEEEIAEHKLTIAKLEAQLLESEASNMALRQRIEELEGFEAELESSEAQVEDLQEELKAEKDNALKFSQLATALKRENGDLEERLRQTENKYKEELEGLRRALADAKSEAFRLKFENEQAKQREKELREQLAAEKRKNEDLEIARQKLERDVKDLKSKLMEAEAAKAEVERLNRANGKQERVILEQQRELKNKEGAIQDLSRRNEEQRRGLDQLAREKSGLERELKTQKDLNEGLKKENEGLRGEIGALTRENAELRRANEQLRNDLKKVTEERDRLNEALRKSEADNASLRQDNDAVRRERDDLNEALRRMREVYAKMQEEKEQFAKQRDEANRAREAAEADRDREAAARAQAEAARDAANVNRAQAEAARDAANVARAQAEAARANADAARVAAEAARQADAKELEELRAFKARAQTGKGLRF